MSHGNRNLAIARSRYTLTLASGAGQLVSTKTQTYDAADGTAMERVMSQTWAFNSATMYDIDPKYQSACVKLRSINMVAEGADQLAAPALAGPTLLGHANLDGADDHLEIALVNNTEVLSWTEDWSIGFHLVEIHNATEGLKRTIATRGSNGIYFSKGAGNWGFYATAVDGHHDPASNEGMSHSHGANTWFVPPDDSKHLFTYLASTGKLRWYCDDVLRATVQMTTTEMTKGVLATDTLNIGDSMAGYYGSSYWDGHIDNLLLMTTNLVDNSAQVTEYFSNSDFESHLEYSDKILSWFKLDPDPDTYPAIADSVGDSTGTHVGGNALTAFVQTGVQQSVAAEQPVVASAVAEDGIGTPEVYVRLAGVSMPNNSQNTAASNGQSTGPSTILAVASTVEAYGLGEYSCVSATFQGDVAATGRLIGGTLVNSDFRLELEAPLVLDGGGLPVFGLGPATEAADNSPSGLVHWTAELEVQLLVNAADADDELG